MILNIIKILFFTTFAYSSSIPSLYLYPILDKIIIKYKPEWCAIQEVTVANMGTSDFSLNVSSTLKTFPNDAEVTLALFRKNGDKYFDFGRKIKHKICDFIKNDKLFYPDILQHSNYPANCPIQAKDYYVLNYRMNFNNLASVMPVGEYKIIADITSKKELGLTVEVYTRAVQQAMTGFGVKKKEETTASTKNADVVLAEL